MSEEDIIIKETINNFIHNEEYEEKQIEKRLEDLIKEKIKDTKSVSVYLSPFIHKFRIRVYLKLKNNHDPMKFRYEFDNEILTNNKRKTTLKRILNELV